MKFYRKIKLQRKNTLGVNEEEWLSNIGAANDI